MADTKTIRIKLIEKGLTVNEFAEQLGLLPCDCSKLIHGHRPLYGYRERAAEILGVPVSDIFSDERPKRGRPPRPKTIGVTLTISGPSIDQPPRPKAISSASRR